MNKCAETGAARFSDTSQIALCYKNGPFVSSGQAVLGQLPPTSLAALERFANALARAATPCLIERAASMVAILEDAAERALIAAAIDGEGKGA